jgi:hypothetical protein
MNIIWVYIWPQNLQIVTSTLYPTNNEWKKYFSKRIMMWNVVTKHGF